MNAVDIPLCLKINIVFEQKQKCPVQWFRTNLILAESEAEIRWYIPNDMPIGKYRISHSGDHKSLLQNEIHHFIGYTDTFVVLYFLMNKRKDLYLL